MDDFGVGVGGFPAGGGGAASERCVLNGDEIGCYLQGVHQRCMRSELHGVHGVVIIVWGVLQHCMCRKERNCN